jgi:hypothetical protein
MGETVMSKITLTRIVKPTIVRDGGRVYVEDKVETLVVHFVDDDGQTVSIGFDGRAEKYADGCRGMVREEYSELSDCPVIDADRQQSGPVSDPVAVLRAALNTMV